MQSNFSRGEPDIGEWDYDNPEAPINHPISTQDPSAQYPAQIAQSQANQNGMAGGKGWFRDVIEANIIKFKREFLKEIP